MLTFLTRWFSPKPALALVEPEPPTSLATVFGDGGRFLHGERFKYNVLTRDNLAARVAVFELLATSSKGTFMSLPYLARKRAFELLKHELQRYFGTARRKWPGRNGEKKGDPLPQLVFPSRAEALKYRRAIERAAKQLKTHLA